VNSPQITASHKIPCDSLSSAITERSAELFIENVRLLLSMASSVSKSIQHDINELNRMLASYDEFNARLSDPGLSNPERSAIRAALHMLKEIMTDKTRDIKRRLRDTRKY
jgi:hypothetical protein